jgi:hypothetical protein
MHFDRDAAAAAEALDSFPEVILPTQIEWGSRLAIALGERRLLWAMLLDAAACFYKHRHARDNSGRKLFREAERWIRSSDSAWPFSFQSVCDLLGLNAQQVRIGLLDWVNGSDRASPRLNYENRATVVQQAREICHARPAGGSPAASSRPAPSIGTGPSARGALS